MNVDELVESGPIYYAPGVEYLQNLEETFWQYPYDVNQYKIEEGDHAFDSSTHNTGTILSDGETHFLPQQTSLTNRGDNGQYVNGWKGGYNATVPPAGTDKDETH